MKMIFTESYEDLKNKLSEIDGEWDESQPNKKALRLNSGVMNWYETTGTINFQGKEGPKRELEKLVALVLNIEIKPGAAVEITVDTDKQNQQTDKGDDNVSKQFLEGRFDTSEIIIGIVSAVGTESSRVITPLTDRLRQFSYMTTEIRVSSLLKSSGASTSMKELKTL
ncbi:MAG: hypothetical protein LWX52_14955 [Deltaproteobacteria bacterium]|jgi:hypothetical protein|nr:hypothetical protein [Deltaproteobacteria bacterium]